MQSTGDRGWSDLWPEPTALLIGHARSPDFLFHAGDLMPGFTQILASPPSATRFAEQNRKGGLWQVLVRLVGCNRGKSNAVS